MSLYVTRTFVKNRLRVEVKIKKISEKSRRWRLENFYLISMSMMTKYIYMYWCVGKIYKLCIVSKTVLVFLKVARAFIESK